MSNCINLIAQYAGSSHVDPTELKARNIGTAVFDVAAVITLVVVATLGMYQIGHLSSMTHQTAYILYGVAGGVILIDLAGLAIRYVMSKIAGKKFERLKHNAGFEVI